MWQQKKGTPNVLPSGCVHVWRFALTPSTLTNDALQCLSQDEKDRGARFIKPVDREKFLMSRWLLRKTLSHYAGKSAESLAFITEAHGKPSLKDCALRFNLSHAGDCLLIAISRDIAVGVDVECQKPIADILGIAQRFFAPSEFQAISSLSGQAQIDAFYRCWTRKEAFIKATGLGLSFGLSAFEVNVDDTSMTQNTLCHIHKINYQPLGWGVFALPMDDFFPGYYAAVAAAQQKVTFVLSSDIKTS